MKTGYRVVNGIIVLLTAVLMLAGCGGGKSTPVMLTAITVTPSNVSIAPGTTARLKASGSFSDGSYQDLTTSVMWSSPSVGAVSVSNVEGSKGLVTALDTGTTTIIATLGSVSGSATVTSAALTSIVVTPAEPTVIVGTSKQFKATGILSNNVTQDLSSLVIWRSADSSVATIDVSGITSVLAVGEATISADFRGISGSTVLTAATVTSIAVTPANTTIAVGTSQPFSAIGTLSNSTTQDVTPLVTWNSSNPLTAAINVNGIASSFSIGSTTVSATYSGVSGSATMTVQGPVSIAVTPANPTVVVGSTQKFTAVGTFANGSIQDVSNLVVWSSSNNGVASISNASGSRGVATVRAAGSASITATLGVSGTATVAAKSLDSITTAPLSPTIGTGSTIQFTATGRFSDGTTQDLTASVTWRTSNSVIATISNVNGTNGLLTALTPGSTTITATFGTISKSTALAVYQANRAYVANNGSKTLSVIDTASNSVVATVDVGIGPQGVAINANANRVYMANSGSNTVSVVDTSINAVVATIDIGSRPMGIDVNPSTNRAYVVNSYSNTLSVIDTINNRVVTTINVGLGPQAIALNRSTNLAYVTNSTGNSVSVIDTANNSLVATIPVGTGPQGVVVLPASNRAYVANSNSNSISVIDTTSNAVVTTINTGTKPLGLAVNPDVKRVYVANSNSNSMSVIDTTENTVVATIALGIAPQAVAVNTATNKAYVTTSGASALAVIDLSNNSMVSTIGVGISPSGVAVM
ncbi:MAG: Ig-like domain-containing protein [Desulfuromonadaceae bacterium]|nr:Ig-like domain-containing protein [Desulfuromonadaceae bacterium]